LPRITISSGRQNQGFVRVVVTDNGCGLDEREQDPFSALATTKVTGLGLGLSLSRTIVEAHGGRIWIERSGKEGTSIGFTLKEAPFSAEVMADEGANPSGTPT
jgi:two-component system sensor kinase FixL